MRINVYYHAEMVEKVPDSIMRDLIEIKIDNHPDSRGSFLGDTDLMDVVVFNKRSFIMENGIQFSLENIDKNSIRINKFAVGVFP